MNKIITISREFGSGGREIGKRLADELGFNYYDREIVTEVAKQTGMTEEYIKKYFLKRKVIPSMLSNLQNHLQCIQEYKAIKQKY